MQELFDMRTSFQLTPREADQFYRLRALPGEAFAFWKQVAKERKLDPKTILSEAPKFSGMALGHGKQWCFPHALLCKKKPTYSE
jgi:hypothetical protein